MCTLGFVSDGCFLVLHLFGALYKRIIERIAAAIQIRSEIVNAIRSSAVLFSSQHKNKTAVLLFERKRIVAKVRFWVWTFCILFYKIVL